MLQLKQNGVELEIKSPDGKTHYGDCFITMTGVIWCKGRKPKKSGVKVDWEQLMEICATEEKLKAAMKAAKAVS
jgi:hypothetical protein